MIFPPPIPEGEDQKTTINIQHHQLKMLLDRISQLTQQVEIESLKKNMAWLEGFRKGQDDEKEKHKLQPRKKRRKTPARKTDGKGRKIHKTNVQKKPTDREG